MTCNKLNNCHSNTNSCDVGYHYDDVSCNDYQVKVEYNYQMLDCDTNSHQYNECVVEQPVQCRSVCLQPVLVQPCNTTQALQGAQGPKGERGEQGPQGRHVTSGTLVGTILRFGMSDDTNIDVDVSDLLSKSPSEPSNQIVNDGLPRIVSGSATVNGSDYLIDLLRNDDSKISINLNDVVNGSKPANYTLSMEYTIKTVDENYTTVNDDFNGRTLIRANKNGDQTVILTKPSDEAIGRSIIIRKTAGAPGTTVTLRGAEGVTISPEDASPLRRAGNAVSLVYVGNGLWDAFGELP